MWGAGDLATLSTFPVGLDRGIQKELTNIFNKLTNGTLPASVIEIPDFFVYPNPYYVKLIKSPKTRISYLAATIKNSLRYLDIDIPFLSFRNYHFLWYNFLDNEKKNLTLFCFHYNNCSDPRNFKVAPKSESNVINILENPTEGVVIEETVTKPPCDKTSPSTTVMPVIGLVMYGPVTWKCASEPILGG